MPPSDQAIEPDGFDNAVTDGWGEAAVSGLDYDKLGAAVARSLMDAANPASITASVVRTSGWDGLPIAPDGREWDDLAAKRRLNDWAGDDISGKYARAFLYRDSTMDPDLKTAYSFPIADNIDGDLTNVPAAVRNAASRLSQSSIPAEKQEKMRALIERLLDRTREARDTMSQWNHENVLADVIDRSPESEPDSIRHFSTPAISDSSERENFQCSRCALTVGSEFTTEGPSDAGSVRVGTKSGTRLSAQSVFVKKTQKSGKSGTRLEDSVETTELSTPISCKCSETEGKSAKYAASPSESKRAGGARKAHDSTTAMKLDAHEGFSAAHATEASACSATMSNASNRRSDTFASTSKGDSPHTGAMVALRMTDADATRLAVDGWLPPEDMHMTLAYLGEAADISEDARERITRSMTRIANKIGEPIEAEGFSVNAFNPGDANDRLTAIVMGVNGATLSDMQQGVCKALGRCEGYEMPGAARAICGP
jgi:hypothetical protein